MSLFKKLFGRGNADEGAKASAGPSQEYKGFTITSTPFKADGQWQLCGTITRTVDGVVKEHRFIRADKFTDIGQANEIALQKGQLIIDQQGAGLFD